MTEAFQKEKLITTLNLTHLTDHAPSLITSRQQVTKYTRFTMRAVFRVFAHCYLLIISSLASAGGPPSDNELKAAYCLKITHVQVAQSAELAGMGGEFKTIYEKQVQDENRLRGYLYPKLGALDAGALMFAVRRAEEDIESYKHIPICQQLFRDGGKTFSKDTKQGLKLMDQCSEAIKNSESAKRIASCSDLKWLPF